MNTKEIIDGNKLIAEFMGGSFWTESAHANFLKKRPKLMPISQKGFIGVSDLKYHTSWDWLMPVVEKINKTNVDSVDFINKRGEKGASFMYAIGEEIARVDRRSVWELVVNFIKWYNENKQP